jgi:hypothetical protein
MYWSSATKRNIHSYPSLNITGTKCECNKATCNDFRWETQQNDTSLHDWCNLHGCSQCICKRGDKLSGDAQSVRYETYDAHPQDPGTTCYAYYWVLLQKAADRHTSSQEIPWMWISVSWHGSCLSQMNPDPTYYLLKIRFIITFPSTHTSSKWLHLFRIFWSKLYTYFSSTFRMSVTCLINSFPSVWSH